MITAYWAKLENFETVEPTVLHRWRVVGGGFASFPIAPDRLDFSAAITMIMRNLNSQTQNPIRIVHACMNDVHTLHQLSYCTVLHTHTHVRYAPNLDVDSSSISGAWVLVVPRAC
jgi:hypothetical protein